MSCKEIVELVECGSEDLTIHAYAPSWVHEMALFPRGVPFLEKLFECKTMIRTARENNELLQWSVRARGEGPYAKARGQKHGSIANCTDLRQEHNPVFRLLQKLLQLKQSIKE